MVERHLRRLGARGVGVILWVRGQGQGWGCVPGGGRMDFWVRGLLVVRGWRLRRGRGVGQARLRSVFKVCLSKMSRCRITTPVLHDGALSHVDIAPTQK